MNSFSVVNTLKIIFEDGSSELLPKWFTDQFSYFVDILEDIGETRYMDNENEYEYLEIYLSSCPNLAKLLTKPVLQFLKKFAYHYTHLYEDDTNVNNDNWFIKDEFQRRIIQKFIDDDKIDELCQIFITSDYLGNIILCQIITDMLIKQISSTNFLNIEKIEKIFGVKSKFQKNKQNEIYKKIQWE